MNTHDIELPPLPPLCIAPSVEPVDYPKVAQALMDYARTAVEADRQQRESIVTDDMRSAIRFAPFSAYWSDVLRDIFGPDAREGIDALERRLRDVEDDRQRRGSIVNNASASSEPWMPVESCPGGNGVRYLFVRDCGQGTLPAVEMGYMLDADTEIYMESTHEPFTKYGYRVTHWTHLPRLPNTSQSLSESDIPDEPDLVKCAECGAELIPVRPGKWQHPDCSQSYWATDHVEVNAIFETQDGEVIGTTDAKVKRVEWQDDGSLTVVIDYWPQPTEPDEWKLAVDHELTNMQSTTDSYPSAKEAVKALIDWHVAVATDPAFQQPSEPVVADAPVPSDDLQGLSDRAYCQYIEQMRRPECLGWEQKIKDGRFGEAELKAHTKAGEFLGRHHAFSEAAALLARYGKTQPAYGKVIDGSTHMWKRIEDYSREVDGKKIDIYLGDFLLYCPELEDEENNGVVIGYYSELFRGWYTSDEKVFPTHFMPLPEKPL